MTISVACWLSRRSSLIAAQQHGRRGARAAQRAQFADALQRFGTRAATAFACLMRSDRSKRGLLAQLGELRGVAAGVRHRLRDAVFEAHRHHPAGAGCGRGEQRATVRALDDRGVVRVVEIGGEAGAVRRFRKGDRRADANQRGMLVRQPAGAEVPPAHGRKHAVEARPFQMQQIATCETRRRGEKAHLRILRAHGCAKLAPEVRPVRGAANRSESRSRRLRRARAIRASTIRAARPCCLRRRNSHRQRCPHDAHGAGRAALLPIRTDGTSPDARRTARHRRRPGRSPDRPAGSRRVDARRRRGCATPRGRACCASNTGCRRR